MNTEQPTKRNLHKKMRSGAVGRRDQEVSGHLRTGPHSSPRAHGRVGEFGTIGAMLSRPTR